LEWINNHKCTNLGWSHSSHFGVEPKTHPLPPPKVFSVFFFALKFSPPTYLTSFCTHSLPKPKRTWNLKAWSGSLKQEAKSGSQGHALKARGQKWEGRSGSQKREGSKRVEARAWREAPSLLFIFFLLFC
jgi:hypothetical protein